MMFNQAIELLRQLGIIPPDLATGAADPRWAEIAPQIAVAEVALERAYNDGIADAVEDEAKR